MRHFQHIVHLNFVSLPASGAITKGPKIISFLAYGFSIDSCDIVSDSVRNNATKLLVVKEFQIMNSNNQQMRPADGNQH